MAIALDKLLPRDRAIKKKKATVALKPIPRFQPDPDAEKAKKCEQVFQDVWTKLETFLRETFVPAEVRPQPDKASYMELCSGIHNLCQEIPPIYRRSLDRYNRACSQLARNLYANIKKFLEEYLRNIAAAGVQVAGNKELLMFYSKQCEDYKSASKLLNDICGPMNKNWIVDSQTVMRLGIRNIYDLALCTWHETLFKLLENKVTTSVLEIIHYDRDNAKVIFSHAHEIKEAISSFVDMGLLYEDATTKKYLFIYSQHFEQKFLDATRSYYAEHLNSILNADNPKESVMMIESIIGLEELRVHKMLHGSTLSKVAAVCIETLVLDHIRVLYKAFKNLLENPEETEGLTSFYSIIKRISVAHIHEMADKFQELLAEIAIAKFNRPLNPKEFCTGLIKFLATYKKVVEERFDGLLVFKQAVGKSCEVFMNCGLGSFLKISDHLAKYADILLTDPDFEFENTKKKLCEIVSILAFIDEKDVLEKRLKHVYGNRLLWSSSNSEELESFFINELKVPMGRDCTRKLTQMYQDKVHISEAMGRSFQEYLQQLEARLSFHFQPYVLAGASWDYPIEQTPFVFPKILDEPMDHFKTFYQSRYGNKKLVWIPFKAGGELKFNVGGRSIQLTVSTYEMTILLLYNDADQYTLAELEAATKLDLEKLEQIVAHLVYAKLLIFDGQPIPIKDEKNILRIAKILGCLKQNGQETVIKYNTEYKPTKHKLKVNFPLRTDVNKEEQKLDEDIKRNREFQLQAILVKILKTRKQISRQELLSEASKECQANHHYFPTLNDVQRQIKLLTDKEYMRALDENTVEYIA